MKLKDKKIEILTSTFSTDEIGNRIRDYETVARVWAYYRQLSGKEINGITTQATEACLFRVNYRDNLSCENFIRFKGKIYDIVRVDRYEGYRDTLTLYCKKKEK